MLSFRPPVRPNARPARVLPFVCLLLWSLTGGAPAAEAASVQNTQSGALTSVANGTQSVTITSVDMTKSVLFFSTRHDSNRPVGSVIRGRLASATTIEFVRVTDGVAPEPAPIEIRWYVVTWASGVRVQRGEVTQSTATVDVLLSPLAAVNQAFVLWSKTAAAGDATWGSDDSVLGEITGTTNVQFRADASSGHVIAWQVVEFTNAADITVQKGSITSMTGSTTSVTATLSPAVDINKTFVLAGWRSSGGGATIGARMLRARLTSADTVTIDRSVSGAGDDITEIVWQAIELKDASIVQAGSSSFAAGVPTATVQLPSSVNTARMVPFGSGQSGGGQNTGRSPYIGDDVTGVGSVTLDASIALRASATATAGSGTLTLTIPKPAGTFEDDVMIASIGFRPHTAVVTPPNGWTLLRRSDNAGGSANSLAVYWKTADNAEPASYAWTFSASTGTVGGILSFANVDTVNPIDVEAGGITATGLTHTAPTINTTVRDQMILSVHSFSSSATWTPPAGMTEVVDIASETVPNCCGMALEVNYALKAAIGATGPLAAVASGDGDVGAAQTIALRPSPWARYLTLTRTSTADTADVAWFVVQFDQGPGFKKGSFTKSTGGAPASQVIPHGLGSVPKAIILWTEGKTNETFANTSYLFGFGMTDGTTSRSVAAASQTGQAVISNASTRMANKALTMVQWGEVLVAEADLQSWDATNFTLNWTTNDANAYVVHYIVIGGTDVSAKVLQWNMRTAVGNQSVTGIGFQPNAVIHAHGTHSFTGALPSNLAGAGFGLGAMDADGDQWATTFLTMDNSATSDTQRGQQTDAAIYSFSNALAVQKEASFVSMDADGFTVNFSNAASAAAARVLSLALKGVNVKPGAFNKTNSTPAPVNQAITGVGFQPSMVLLTSFQDVTRAAPVAHARWGIGASDGTTHGSSAKTDQNGVTTTSVRAVDKTSRAFVVADTNNNTSGAEAILSSLDSDGFTLNWVTNNTVQTQILYLAMAPISVTEVTLLSFTGARYDRGVLLQWKTGYEIDNLGFHVYREVNGVRTRATSTLVGGSGLTLGRGTAENGERNYAFWDLAAEGLDPQAVYWLEDVDLDGRSTWHGPVTPSAGGAQVPPVVTSNALGEGTCREQAPGTTVAQPCASGETRQIVAGRADGATLEFVRPRPSDPLHTQWTLAMQGAVKIGVTRPGWYRVGQPALVDAGLSAAVDPRTLRLFVDGVEQAVSVTGQEDGRFDAGDSIEFFATGLDTAYTDTRVYWLAAGTGPGRRIAVTPRRNAAPAAGRAFWQGVQYKERSVYFAALRNGDVENWFGALVSDYEPTAATVRLPHTDLQAGAGPATLELALQGVNADAGGDSPHRVAVSVNGTEIDEVSFAGQDRAVFRLTLPPAVLREGNNVVSLIARGGESDFSLVDHINIGYWQTYRADADQLLLTTADGQGAVTIRGFSTPSIRVVDVTNPGAIVELSATVQADQGLYSAEIDAPAPGARRLFAFTDLTASRPVFVRANQPSSLHASANALDYLVLAPRQFASALAPLLALRTGQGLRSAVIDIEDVYDEFNYGEKSPLALRRFFRWAHATWQGKPRFVVLAGDATMDPRNYSGLGDFDIVPTRLLSMAAVALETASDDWFTDFDDDGMPEIAVGRLPARSVEQADALARKIAGYETQAAGAWTSDVTLVSDDNDASNDFESASRSLAALLPAGFRSHEVLRKTLGTGAGDALAAQVAEGRLVVSYQGHGSTQLWGGQGDLLSSDRARSGWLADSRLPFVVAMNCLNGFFHGIYDEESLAEALLRMPSGGAVAAWASSGLTSAATQQVVSRELFRMLFQDRTLTLGEAAGRAKRVVRQRDIRRSWVFFGDPATRLLGVYTAPGTGGGAGGNGTGGSTGSGSAAVGAAQVRRERLADFDGDGRADTLAYRPQTGEWQIWTATDTLLAGGYWPVGRDVQAASFNGDGLADLFQYDPASGEWARLLNTGTGFTEDAGTTLPEAQVHLGDLNGDGRDDLVMYEPESGAFSIGVADAQGQFAFSTGRWKIRLTVRTGDFDGNGLADILTYDRVSGRLRVMYSESHAPASIVQSTTTHRNLEWAVAKLNGDSRRDLILYEPVSGRWEGWLSSAPRRFVVGGSGTWPGGRALQTADVTGDGRDEAVLYAPDTGAWAVMPTAAGASAALASGVGPSWASTAIGDLDGDAGAEVYLHQPWTGAVVLLDPAPGSTLQQLHGIWPDGWTLHGAAAGEPLDVAWFMEAWDPTGPTPPGSGGVDLEDVRAALVEFGIVIVEDSNRPPAPQPPVGDAGFAGHGVPDVAQGPRVPVVPAAGPRTTGVGWPAAGAADPAASRVRVAAEDVASPASERSEQAAAPVPAAPPVRAAAAAQSRAARPASALPAPPQGNPPPLQMLPAVVWTGQLPQPLPGVVTTDDATQITATSATLNGGVKRLGSGARVGFLWGPDEATASSTTLHEAEAARVSHEAALTGLVPGTIYYFRIVAEEAGGGRKVGAMKSFRTSPAAEPEAVSEEEGATGTPAAKAAATPVKAAVKATVKAPAKAQPSGERIRPAGGS